MRLHLLVAEAARRLAERTHGEKALARLEVRPGGLLQKKIYSHVTWSFVFVNAEARAELDALPQDVRASFERVVRLVQALDSSGYTSLTSTSRVRFGRSAAWKRQDCARPLRDRDRQAVVILRVFTKKTQRRHAAKSSSPGDVRRR
jgi:phage-related protein